MEAEAASASASLSAGAPWAGWIITGLLVVLLSLDAVLKVIGIAPVVEASKELGVPPHSLLGIGLVLLACTAIFAIPRTAVLGAILLTGYLGGAVAVHVCAGSGVFPVVFAIAFGVLSWVGLVLRDPRLLRTILSWQ